MEQNILYMTQSGIDKLYEEVKEYEAKLQQLYRDRIGNYNGDNRTDRYNSEYEESVRQEQMLRESINRCYDELRRVVLVERQNDEEIIDINDVLVIDICPSGEKSDEMTFKLVGSNGNFMAPLKEIYVNSPLGTAVYKKPVGTQCSYSVQGNIINVLIKSKINLEEEQVKTR